MLPPTSPSGKTSADTHSIPADPSTGKLDTPFGAPRDAPRKPTPPGPAAVPNLPFTRPMTAEEPSADAFPIFESQRLYLELLRRSSFNLFEGNRVVNDL